MPVVWMKALDADANDAATAIAAFNDLVTRDDRVDVVLLPAA